MQSGDDALRMSQALPTRNLNEVRVPAAANGRVELLILGRLDVHDAAGRDVRSVITQPKRLALLSYLALTGRDRFRRRDTVVGFFWPELDQLRARAALRQALSWLRHELGPGVLINRGEEEIGVAADALECDAVAFDEAIASHQPDRALALYRGDLLDGVFVAGASPELERWLDEERNRRLQQATRAAMELAEAEAARGRPREAVEWARRATSLSPNDEGNHRRLIQLLAAVGDRAGALEAHSAFRARLVRDYGAEPSSETIRLMAEVQARLPGESQPLDSTSTRGAISPLPSIDARRVPESKKRRRLNAVLALGVVAVIATVVLARPRRSRGADAPVSAPSLIVMPLANSTGDTVVDMLVQGITAGVTRALSRSGDIRVITRSSSPRPVWGTADIREAGRVAGASAGVAWRVTHHADSLVIETNLVRVGSSAQPVTRAYPFRTSALLSTEQEIAADLAASLRPVDSSRPPGSLARRATSKPDSAYMLLLKAEHHLAKRTDAGLHRGRALANEAIELEPTYGDAYAVLAVAYQGFAWYGLEPPDQAFMKAEAAARRAVALDSTSGLGHAMIAATLSFYRYRWEDGEEEFRRAIALDPGNAMIRNFFSIHLRSLGRFPEALAEVRRAQEMDQLYRHYFWTSGFILTLAGRDEDAIMEFRRALAIDSSFLRARLALSDALARRGRHDAALREWRTGLVISGDSARSALVGAARGEAGYREVRRRLGAIDVQRLRRRVADGEYVAAFDLANALLDTGDREAAIAEFERSFAVRDPRLTYLFFAPRYRDVRRDPRIQALERAMNLRGIP